MKWKLRFYLSHVLVLGCLGCTWTVVKVWARCWMEACLRRARHWRALEGEIRRPARVPMSTHRIRLRDRVMRYDPNHLRQTLPHPTAWPLGPSKHRYSSNPSLMQGSGADATLTHLQPSQQTARHSASELAITYPEAKPSPYILFEQKLPSARHCFPVPSTATDKRRNISPHITPNSSCSPSSALLQD